MTSSFWKAGFENLGTELDFSSTYHPQTDGQSEIANLTIIDLLKAYVTEVDQTDQWEKYLPLVEYAYNKTVHTSTGKAPFEVIEGIPKLPLIVKLLGKIFAVDEFSQELNSFQKIKEAISITQQKQKDAPVRFVLPIVEQAHWDVKDAQAHSLIALSVKCTITLHIRSAKFAEQAWDILVGLYVGRNEAKISLLRKELESKIMNEEDDMDTFLAGVKDINEQLISADEVFSDSFLVQTVLDALPDS
ncbi:hypothetical protein L7F22_051899 [Adiantum nelumboides]|nr:hypothetical protein [Adiantum nelumboides]